MTRLDDLPNESLAYILAALHTWDGSNGRYFPSRHDLRQVCLVSKKLLPCAQSILYSWFGCLKVDETWRIRAFLRAIIANPSLARHVKKVDLHRWRAWNRESDEWDDIGYDHQRTYSTTQNNYDRKLFQRAIRALALSDKTFWRHAVRKNVDEVYVALLLLLLPNLRDLRISAPSEPEILAKAFLHATVLHPACAQVMGLQQVEKVWYCVRGNVSQADVHDIAPFFRIPSLRTLEIGERLASRTVLWPKLPEPSAITHLHFSHAAIVPRVLADILHVTRCLERFHYNHCNLSRGDDLMEFHPERFKDALQVAAHSLRELHVQADCDGSSRLLRQSMGSLHQFSQLQTLRTALKLLLGHPSEGLHVRLIEILPSSLEVLELTDLHSDYVDRLCQVIELVETKAAVVPRLKKISELSLWHAERERPPQKDMFLRLVNACREAKVALEGRDLIGDRVLLT